MGFNITSNAIEYGAKIPNVYTCEGDAMLPRLRWDQEPAETVTFALKDPDAPAGTFIHWIVYNIPSDCHELEKITPKGKQLDNGAFQSKNDFGKMDYNNPYPPPGSMHRYFFRIYALRKKLPPELIQNSAQFHNAIEKFILDEAEYMGTYYRKT